MLLQGKVLSGTYWLYLTWREPWRYSKLQSLNCREASGQNPYSDPILAANTLKESDSMSCCWA